MDKKGKKGEATDKQTKESITSRDVGDQKGTGTKQPTTNPISSSSSAVTHESVPDTQGKLTQEELVQGEGVDMKRRSTSGTSNEELLQAVTNLANMIHNVGVQMDVLGHRTTLLEKRVSANTNQEEEIGEVHSDEEGDEEELNLYLMSIRGEKSRREAERRKKKENTTRRKSIVQTYLDNKRGNTRDDMKDRDIRKSVAKSFAYWFDE